MEVKKELRVIRSKEELGRLRLEARLEHFLKTAEEIIQRVRAEGDQALIELTKKFDGVDLSRSGLRVPRERFSEAYKRMEGRGVKALEKLFSRIKWVERQLLRRLSFSMKTLDGVRLSLKPLPLESVGCYVPGGGARYPTTLLMTVTPAKVAGVERVVVTTPPPLDDATLAAAYIAGVDELYLVGGAQAIAAMTYGTQSIKPVLKIVGPGGGYVAAAKLLVSRDVAIDFPAGPTELLVVAEEEVDAYRVALELLSQAEHSPDTMVGLVTGSERFAEQVDEAFEEAASRAERGAVVLEAWRRNGFIALASSPEEAAEIINEVAPEHLSIYMRNPGKLLERVRNVGLISVNTPSALSDYLVGTNHVLPTWGWARIRGGLSVLDYVKLVYSVRAPKTSLRRMAPWVKLLSDLEGLPAHGEAVEAET